MPERSAALVAVIPARIGSTRFPEKPLARIAGVPMIARVVERVRESGAFDHILVATDDERIANAARNAGADARMTDSDLANGTLRCHAALCQWEAEVGYEATWVVNVQGDEPFVHPEQLQKLAQLIRKAGTSIATLARPKSADDPERSECEPGQGGVRPERARAVFQPPAPALRGGSLVGTRRAVCVCPGHP